MSIFLYLSHIPVYKATGQHQFCQLFLDSYILTFHPDNISQTEVSLVEQLLVEVCPTYKYETALIMQNEHIYDFI